MCNHHSGSLNSLPMVDRSMTSSRNKSSYRSSLNDATSLESSRAAEDFDKILIDRVTDAVNLGIGTGIDKRRHELLPFPTAAVAPATSETKITSEEDEEEDDNIANAVIPLVEEVEIATGEALPLYDFGQRDERDAHHHLPHQYHHHYHHKQHYVNGKEGNREVRGDQTDGESDIDDESMQTEMMNVKKETSV